VPSSRRAGSRRLRLHEAFLARHIRWTKYILKPGSRRPCLRVIWNGLCCWGAPMGPAVTALHRQTNFRDSGQSSDSTKYFCSRSRKEARKHGCQRHLGSTFWCPVQVFGCRSTSPCKRTIREDYTKCFRSQRPKGTHGLGPEIRPISQAQLEYTGLDEA
jgi:hypothetical protein